MPCKRLLAGVTSKNGRPIYSRDAGEGLPARIQILRSVSTVSKNTHYPDVVHIDSQAVGRQMSPCCRQFLQLRQLYRDSIAPENGNAVTNDK